MGSATQQPATLQEQTAQPSSSPPQDDMQLASPQLHLEQRLPQALERINAAADLSTLTDPELRPWHLQLAFDLLDPNGTVHEHGTLEEWWAAPHRYRIQIASPTYSATRTEDGKATFRTKGQAEAPDLDDLLLSQAVRPLQRIRADESLTAFQQKTPFGKVTLDCVMPLSKRDNTMHYIGEYTTYCFEPGDPVLRSLIRYREQVIIRNKKARFQNREIAMNVAVVDGGKIVAKSEITKLSTYTPGEHDFDATPEQEEVPPLVRVGQAVQSGRLLVKKSPIYPEDARYRHISGVVVLRARIGADGHVASLSLIRSPDKLLSEAAMQAVKEWVYQPFLVDGVGKEVETTVTVNFNMSR